MLKKYLEIGKIVGTHALKGEVRVECWCDSPQFISNFNHLYFDEGKTKLTVKSRPHKNIAIVKIKGIDTIEQADMLRSKILYIDRNDIELDEDVYFVQDIIGLCVKHYETKEEYGTVSDVLKTGANDVYEVKQGNNTYYLPVIDDVIMSTDIENGELLIKPMKGLFGDED